MKTLSALRRIDNDSFAPAKIQTQLEHQGYQTQLRRPQAGLRYLRFRALFEDLSELHGLIEFSAWANTALPALEGIDWMSLEDNVLHPLIAEHPLHISLSHQHAPFNEMHVVELISNANSAHELPCLNGTPGIVMVEQFIPHLPQDSSEIATLSHLHVPLTFSIGYSVLPCEALNTIEVGDVLLIEHIKGRVSSNGKTLFTTELNQEALMILDRTEQEPEHHEPSGAASDNATGLNSLPIELSVVLMEKVVPLAQLKAITPGEVIELPQDTMLDVEIRANRHCFARGELVQLANGQLGVEIRTLWPQE